jgi:hypothetical protein
MNAKEWHDNIYNPLVEKHSVAIATPWDVLDIKYQVFFGELYRSLSVPDPKISKKNVEFFLENLSWQEQQIVYDKLHKIGHKIY